MNKVIQSGFVFSVVALVAFGVSAQSSRLTRDQLIAYGNERQLCGEDRTVIDANYKADTGNEVTFQCGEATGFLPLAVAGGLGGVGAGAAALGAVGLAALAGGGGSSTPDTQ